MKDSETEKKEVDWSAAVAIKLKERIEKLEKELGAPFIERTNRDIAELREFEKETKRTIETFPYVSLDAFNELKERLEKEINHCSNHSNEIDELKEQINTPIQTLKEWKIGIIDRIINGEEVLRLIVSLTIPNHLKQELLEKLDGSSRFMESEPYKETIRKLDGKTVKKECQDGEHLFQDIFDDIENRICVICGLIKNKKDLKTEKKASGGE